MICGKCKKKTADDSIYCEHCGAMLVKIRNISKQNTVELKEKITELEAEINPSRKDGVFCIYCGSKLPEVAFFCYKCGKPRFFGTEI